ncbi:Lrp/AsnC family transcriptional regulator [Chelativorans sp.]|uniref:Lrp/AsnC family transcriptional regulator n=1 Tax=Chelativorans sp. TaxID=2203393 RepID=UPI0028123A46|nr:Lrp/AsnC family transcriptional regulator [Chelativorans sp.]
MKHFQIHSELDQVDQQILTILSKDARISISDLSRQVGLSAPSVSERIRRMEAQGVIEGFTVDVSPRALGYTLQAIVRVNPLPGMLHVVERLIQETPQFVECDKVTGDDCFVCRLHLRSIEELDQVLDQLAEKARTNTSIVKATPVKRRLPPLR